MNLSTASRTFQLLSRIFDVRTPTEPFLPNTYFDWLSFVISTMIYSI